MTRIPQIYVLIDILLCLVFIDMIDVKTERFSFKIEGTEIIQNGFVRIAKIPDFGNPGAIKHILVDGKFQLVEPALTINYLVEACDSKCNKFVADSKSIYFLISEEASRVIKELYFSRCSGDNKRCKITRVIMKGNALYVKEKGKKDKVIELTDVIEPL